MGVMSPGQLIRAERLRRGWSQEGLCRGVCAVSYLSKIEQGKAEASEEVLRLLLGRLELHWEDDAAGAAARAVDAVYEAIFTLDGAAYEKARTALREQRDLCLRSPSMLDLLVLESWEADAPDPLLASFDMSLRQETLVLLLRNQAAEAAARDRCPFTLYRLGSSLYTRGSYPGAIEALQEAYGAAAREGYVYLMLHSQVLLSSCYSNLLDLGRMLPHLRIAERLAAALGDTALLEQLRYNLAATKLELGRYAEAYELLSGLSERTALTSHKLAVCCEKLGRPEEALRHLDAAEAAPEDFPDRTTLAEMCALVRFRLRDRDYLHDPGYGTLLLGTFRRLRETAPHGFAAFHLPWVLEWYQANRQYKQALRLIQEFPHPVTNPDVIDKN